jgi:hypothetical protein
MGRTRRITARTRELHAEIRAAIIEGDTTLDEIGGALGFTREYIRQLINTMPDSGALRVRMHANRGARDGINAFGERKTPADWARDPRCHVPLHLLTQRLRHGWDPQEAISAPPGARAKKTLTDEQASELAALASRASRVRGNHPADHPDRLAALHRDQLVRQYQQSGVTAQEIANRIGAKLGTVTLWLGYTSRYTRYQPKKKEEAS